MKKFFLLFLFCFLLASPVFADCPSSLPDGYNTFGELSGSLSGGVYYTTPDQNICHVPVGDTLLFSGDVLLCDSGTYPDGCRNVSGTISDNSIIHSSIDLYNCGTSDIYFSADCSFEPPTPYTPTFLDNSVDTFVSESGGIDFLKTLFAIPVIFGIIASMIRPFIY